MTRGNAEDWSDKGVYQTLRLIFLRRKAHELGPIYSIRPKDDLGRDVALSKDEWKGVVEVFAQAKVREYLQPLHRGSPNFKPLPPAIDEALSVPGSNVSRLAGYAFFATNASDHKWALRKLKARSLFGDNASREQMKRIRREVPRVKKQLGPLEILGLRKGRPLPGIIQYRAERTLLWIFIREELRKAQCDFDATDWHSRNHLQSAVAELLDALPWLKEEEYSLSTDRIISMVQNPKIADEDSVRNPKIADEETRRRFGLPSVPALRTLLSKRKRPRRPTT